MSGNLVPTLEISENSEKSIIGTGARGYVARSCFFKTAIACNGEANKPAALSVDGPGSPGATVALPTSAALHEWQHKHQKLETGAGVDPVTLLTPSSSQHVFLLPCASFWPLAYSKAYWAFLRFSGISCSECAGQSCHCRKVQRP